MIVYLNGRFTPEEKAVISIHDRGFLYGDGLFESIRIYGGEPFLWQAHTARFEHGCKVLQLCSPLSTGELGRVLNELLRRNGLSDALVRITLSRGRGPRGYSPRGADHPTLLVVPFPAPTVAREYRAVTSSVQLPDSDAIADFKHLNKLHQVVARAEADAAGVEEALLANNSGFIIEGTTTNLFWVRGMAIETAPVRGILAGTTRAHVLRVCARLKIPTREASIRPEELQKMDGAFVTSCAAEITELTELDGQKLRRSPLVTRLKSEYRSE